MRQMLAAAFGAALAGVAMADEPCPPRPLWEPYELTERIVGNSVIVADVVGVRSEDEMGVLTLENVRLIFGPVIESSEIYNSFRYPDDLNEVHRRLAFYSYVPDKFEIEIVRPAELLEIEERIAQLRAKNVSPASIRFRDAARRRIELISELGSGYSGPFILVVKTGRHGRLIFAPIRCFGLPFFRYDSAFEDDLPRFMPEARE